jgi:hypothetical protein
MGADSGPSEAGTPGDARSDATLDAGAPDASGLPEAGGGCSTGGDGSPCSIGATAGVCSSGTCTPCTVNAACNPGGNPCQNGVMSCSTGPKCNFQSNVGDGTVLAACGTNEICLGGACAIQCDAASCSGCCNGNTCETAAGETTAMCGTATAGAACGPCGVNQTCTGGACACDASFPTGCGGVCVNTVSDANNCGRCGHSCGAGLCTAGLCQPVTVAPSVFFPVGLALTATSVYWTESQDFEDIELNGSINVAPLAGGSYSVVASQQNDATGIAANENGVFWTTQSDFSLTPALLGGLMWLPNGATTPIHLGANFNSPAAVTLTSTAVYWADDTTAAVAETLLSLPLTTLTASAVPTAVTMTNVANTNITCVLAMVPNPSTLFLMTSGCFADNGRLMASTIAPLGNPADILLAGTALSGPYGQARIAVDASNVYFADSGTGVAAIVSVPIGGGALSVRAPATSPGGVAVDANNVYWTDAGDGSVAGGSIFALPLAGGSVVTVASGQNVPYDIGLTATSIYWTNMSANGNGAGSVMMVAKP